MMEPKITIERPFQAPVSPWLTRREAAAYLRVSLATFDTWVVELNIPKGKVRGKQSVRFHRDDLDAVVIPEQRPST